MSDTAKLTLGEQELELPIIVGSEQERGLDISKLRGATGAITLDEGFVNTGSTQSGITFLNGEQGILPSSRLIQNWDTWKTSSQ
jgi:citrate synthase